MRSGSCTPAIVDSAAGVIEASIAAVRESRTRAPCTRISVRASAPSITSSESPISRRWLPSSALQCRGSTRAGRPALDIPAAIRIVLERAGVDDFADSGICTADSDDYFSYRRDGETGRQATIAVLP